VPYSLAMRYSLLTFALLVVLPLLLVGCGKKY
jgi:hypothetical protein